MKIERSSRVFGPVDAIITLYKGSILMLIPIKSRGIMVGLVLQRATNVEYISSRIIELQAQQDYVGFYGVYTEHKMKKTRQLSEKKF
jgi:hypothetical protein